MVFRITPKRLNTVNVLRSTSKLILPVIHPKMLCKSHINQTMITAPSVSIDDALNGDMSAYNLWGCTRLADMLPSKYEDNTLQIKEKSTERTAPFFVLEVTARSAADILGIHPNSAVLFYRKIRMVSAIIWPWLPMGFSRVLSSWTKAISADGVKADVVAVRREKWLSSAFWNVTDGSIPLS